MIQFLSTRGLGPMACSLSQLTRNIRVHSIQCIKLSKSLHREPLEHGIRRAFATVTTSSVGAETGRANANRDPMFRWKIDLVGDKIYAEDKLSSNKVSIPGRWLRDICSCSSCRNRDTAQRQINVFHPTFADACKISKIQSIDSPSGRAFQVTFKDGHQSLILAIRLEQRHAHEQALHRAGQTDMTFWDSDISKQPPVVNYQAVRDGPGMAELMRKIQEFGFCFVSEMPVDPSKTESFLQSVGPIRNTHYGGFYDFTSDLSMKDTAYTSEALEPHTDTTYFTEPAGLQALHLLSHTSGSNVGGRTWEDGLGGESILVDGFAAAQKLLSQDENAYQLLSTVGVYGHASGNQGISIQPSRGFPTISHHPETGLIEQVRWNNADRAGVIASWNILDAWYDAAAKFDGLLHDQKNQYEFQLKPGTLLRM
ncbi:hypothetical protein M433DRAFT_146629 [Acidomyces richmondensis BFW]|nr:MAG: hypothetical protein FE78DRAFT_74668 [Acidomyces sp. 'richmondensis']KYG42614.1 hypothetical protein M433DRAFT_146629 [Acidomyces richmondensis BFW]